MKFNPYSSEENTMSDFQAAAAASMVKVYEREVERSVPEALESLRAAKAEIEAIEAQLAAAVAGEAYKNIGEIKGVQAGAVFTAFGAIQSLASARKFLANAEESA